jgi:glycosyltransferase involved in cell wall biosynthesis
MGFKVGIFVQNAYMTHINLEPNMPDALIESYKNADLILAISEDSAQYIRDIFGILGDKIIPQRCSVDSMLFKPNKKNKIITYMPRKMGAHSIRVVSALQPLLPDDWSIISIDNVMESQVATILSQSSIFLSFSEFEGLGLPPIEAALCGNLVVGYHGQGGKDFWYEPIFHNVDQGDIRKFVSTTLREINKIEKEKFLLNFMNNERVKLAEKFSQNQEVNHLVELDSRVGNLFSHVEND